MINITKRRTIEKDGAAPINRSAPGLRYAADVSLIALGIFAFVLVLYFGREVLLPLVLALILRLIFSPAQRFLTERGRWPSSLAAIFIVVSFFSLIVIAGFTISVPANKWLQQAPQALPVLKQKLAVLRRPIDYLQQGLKEIENATTATGLPSSDSEPTVTVKPPPVLSGTLASGATNTLARFFTTLVFLFFLLASGDRLLRGFIEVLPRIADKKQTLIIANEIEQNITTYLVTVSLMNALVGTATGLVMWMLGLGDPFLWGIAAFLLNYVPILGPMVGVATFFGVGIFTYESPWYAFIPAGAYLLIHIVEGETVTPMLLADRLTLNPVLVIVSLFFWHTLWGIPGAILAVPLLAIIKILCDRVEALKPVGHIIGS
jgi:predicted PurR-regulated permease PerM